MPDAADRGIAGRWRRRSNQLIVYAQTETLGPAGNPQFKIEFGRRTSFEEQPDPAIPGILGLLHQPEIARRKPRLQPVSAVKIYPERVARFPVGIDACFGDCAGEVGRTAERVEERHAFARPTEVE